MSLASGSLRRIRWRWVPAFSAAMAKHCAGPKPKQRKPFACGIRRRPRHGMRMPATTRAAASAAEQNQPAPPFTDPGEAGRQAARDLLARARTQLAGSGDTVAVSLRDEAEIAPEESSWLDDLGGFTADVGANVVNDVASVGNAMLNHPEDVAAALAGIGLTVASGAGEGLGLGLSATGAGAVAGVPVSAVSAAGMTAGVGITGAAMASIASNAAGGDRVEPVKTGEAAPNGPESRTGSVRLCEQTREAGPRIRAQTQTRTFAREVRWPRRGNDRNRQKPAWARCPGIRSIRGRAEHRWPTRSCTRGRRQRSTQDWNSIHAMTQRPATRPLGDREREIAKRVVNAALIPDADHLITQLDTATVDPDSSPTFLDLAVPRTAPRSAATDGPLPGRYLIHGEAGELEGEVMLWMSDGYLSGLELAWYTDEPPTEWPSPDRLATG
jgi:hypothetical protein